MTTSEDPVHVVEQAMVAIRRRQSRRTLATAARDAGQPLPVADSLLAVLDVLDGVQRPVTLGAVAELLALDQPRASKLVADGVRRGMIERGADQADGRRTLLTLTPAGSDAVEAVHRHRRDRFAAAMAGWSGVERAEFARLLRRFVADFEA